jgi:hypothetical protein
LVAPLLLGLTLGAGAHVFHVLKGEAI